MTNRRQEVSTSYRSHLQLSANEAHVSAMIEQEQAIGLRVVLRGMMVSPNHEWNCAFALYELFPRRAARYDCPFLLHGVSRRADLDGPDGIHLNQCRAVYVAETMWPYLELFLEAPELRLVAAARVK